ncbi:hypothetical protein FGO68_gene6753 [Halteria grandinella]|uniref:Acyl-coenzyme A oxidase n=1 Tax=Halteria grandinella TaxID=5974 RepID=A0A8J8T5J9_HALGN|nr:hypothetical protein FGO68_gene6753 [Halteria grandinella]
MQTTGSIRNKVVSSDLQAERNNCNFDQLELTHLLWGGQKEYQRVRGIIADVERYEVLKGSEKWYDMSREEQHENALLRLRTMYDKYFDKYFKEYKPSMTSWWSVGFQGLMPFMVTFSMFYSAVKGLGSDEQGDKWLPLIRTMKMTGCYAQTELGHGSFVQGLETTATFDKEKQEFIINSPTITSFKFWPGDMAIYSDHAIVFAKLIIDGKARGVHGFMVPTRDRQTWAPLPGIEVGEIGPKFGFNSKDNGYLALRQVRIPKGNMLSRLVEVDENGKMHVKGDPRALYGIMLETRVWICRFASQQLSQGLTIAARYAVVRRQFSTLDASKEERKLLEYQTHMFKFGPLLAYIMVMNITSKYLIQEYETLEEELMQKKFDRLDIMHHLSAGYKAAFSKIAYEGIDTCRQACGGVGFSAHSGLPSLQADYAPNTTYEGDNTVMFQQAAKLLLKTYKQSLKGEKAQGYLAYLNDVDGLLKLKGQIITVEQALDLDKLDKALAVRSAYKYKRTMALLKEIESKSENERVHSLAAVDIVGMAHSHILYVAYQIFCANISQLGSIKCPNLRGHLQDLGRLYALSELKNDSASLYEAGYFESTSGTAIQNAQKHLLSKLRPYMIPLIEAWNFPDHLLPSAIGNSYGDIYETQLEWARNSKLNKNPMPKGFKEYMLPILTAKL